MDRTPLEKLGYKIQNSVSPANMTPLQKLGYMNAFKEEDHPRADDGKFGSGSKKEPSKDNKEGVNKVGESINKKIESLQQKIDEINKAGNSERFNPSGEMGGVRSRSKKEKERIFSIYDKTSRDANKLVSERDELKRLYEKYPKLHKKVDAINDLISSGGVTKKGDRIAVSELKSLLKDTQKQIKYIEKRAAA